MRFAFAAMLLMSATALLGAGGAPIRSTMTVKAAVLADCSITSPQSIDFGTYDPGSNAPVEVTTNALQVSCTKGATAVTIGLDNGQYYTGTHRAMRTAGSNGAVYYEIYTSPGRTVIWNRTQTVTYVAISRQPMNIPFYGRVVGAASPAPGDYSDTIMALLNF